MASLFTGNYGMSQLKNRGGGTTHSTNNNNGSCSGGGKEYIFVKMTDSAFQAVEEYQKQLGKNNCGAATIQFIGNSGVLAFPVDNVKTSSKFRFSLEDFDSSIECIEQNRNHLDVVGAMSNRMRIHANDDVYEKTRNRMAAAEEVQKTKCAREIKPNQTDIGRKVKVKVGSSSMNAVNSSSNSNSAIGSSQQFVNNYRTSSNNSSLISNQNTASFKNGNRIAAVSRSSLPPSSMTNNIIASNQQPQQYLQKGSANNVSSNNSISTTINSNINAPKSEISKRKIRERLIHLLALKPFKKPELIQRLNNEGLRDKERGLISVILKDISQLKDNCYNLKHAIWNEVNDNWPFYTEQEIQQLKRRKPQNLTPESSDGGSSSISGQSPSSNYNGCSPSLGIKRPPSSSVSAVNGGIGGGVGISENFYDDIAMMQANSKKARISHFKKEAPVQQPTISRNSLNHNIQQEEDFNKFSYNNNNNNRSPFLNQNDDKYNSPQRQLQQQSPKLCSQSKRSKKQHNPSSTMRQSQPTPPQMPQKHQLQQQHHQLPPPKAAAPIASETQQVPSITRPKTTTEYSSSSNHLPEQETPVTYDFSNYPKIISIDDRRRYKTEFDNDFVEYKTLSKVDVKSAQRFQDLGEQLERTEALSEKKYIEEQIVKEYQKVRDDRIRFKYLHEKLNHIKLRVQEYDDQLREQLREQNRRRFSTNETIDADNYEPSNGNNVNY